jgi:hypothetical protein
MNIPAEALVREQALALNGKVKVIHEMVAESEIIADDSTNIRITKEEKIGGLTIKKDLRNIGGMVD